ncbi:MAG: rod-binding protein [Bdellovibrionales bacterium]|nr:rod-binding protein [Bdellovibrionales bacterium]
MSQIPGSGSPRAPLPNSSNMDWGRDARSAPVTPSNRQPVIDRSKVDPQIVKAAEGMEALFLDHMMQAMRKTVPKGEMGLHNAATEIYEGMLDAEYAKKAAGAGGYGMADLIIAYMDSGRYNAVRGPGAVPGRQPVGPTAANSTGGTNEGRQSEQPGDPVREHQD